MRIRLLAVLLGLAAALPARAGTVAGRVVDSQGAPVAGARVAWYGFRQPDRALLERTKGSARTPQGETKTDAAGSFKVAFDKPSEGIALEISAAGLPSFELEGPYDPADESLDIECLLPLPEKVTGRVVDEEGKPLSGARVRAAPDPEAVEGEGVPFEQTVSQADGSFVLRNAPKAAALRIELSGFAPLRLTRGSSGLASTAVLKRGGSIEGRVVDPSGQAVAGAIVAGGLGAAETDAEGRYRLAAVPTGQASVSVAWKDDLTARRDGLVIRRGEVARVDLALSRSAIITGSVVDAKTRKPIGAARVSVSEGWMPWLPRALRSVRADAQGRFRIPGLVARAYTVAAGRRDYVTVAMPGIVASAATPRAVAFALQRSAGISGWIVDEKGAPVPGARVSVLPALPGRRALLRGLTPTRPAATTMADGGFRLRAIAPDPSVSLEARKEGFVTTRKHGLSTVEGDPRPVTLVLRRGLEARGSVSDSQNQPVAGVELRLNRRVRSDPQMSFSSGRDESAVPAAVSDSQGRFSVTGLEPGDYTGRLSREGFAGKTIPLLEVQRSGATVWPPFVLEASAPISGFVRNRKGDPLAGAQVFSYGGDLSKSSTCDPLGFFRLDGYGQGKQVTVYASAEGYARTQLAATAPAQSLAIVLANTGEIRGRVEDAETKAPIEGFSIRAGTPRGSNLRYSYGSEVSSPDGSFTLSGVPAGKIEVSASAPAYLEAAVTGLEIGEGESKEGVVLSLKRGKELSGRVLEPARGTGVPNATVSWRREHDASGQSFMTSGSGTFMFVPNSSTTDADGRFRYEGLPPERLIFSASHPDFQDATKTVDAGSESAVDLTLSVGGSIAGTVVEHDGRTPVAGAEVSLEEQGGSGASWRNDAARADGSGRFRFDHLKEGRFRANARAESGRSPARDVVLAPDQRIEDVLLQFEGGTRIRGRVTGLPAARLGGLNVSASGQDFQSRTTTSDDGAFVVDDAPHGALRLTASTGSLGRSVGKTVEVPEGASELPVEVEFEVGSRLSGRVTRAERGISALWVSAGPDPPSPSGSRTTGRTDEEGRYELEGLADGAYRLQVSGANVSVSRRVTVSGDTTSDVTLGGARVSGVVTDAVSGEPLSDAWIRAEKGPEGSGMGAPRGVSDSKGYYAIEDLEAGTYQVTAQRDGYQQKTQSVSIGDTSAEASFSLPRGSALSVTVVDGLTGLPLKGLDVVVLNSGSVALQGPVQLDASGRGEISALAPGRYAVHFFSAGYAPRVLPAVDVPSPSLSIPMTPGGRVEVRADAPIGGKVYTAAGALSLRSPWATEGTVTAAPPVTVWGRFEPGAYQLVMSSPNSGKSYPFTVTEGRTTTVQIGK